jgi:TonB family protein
MILLESPLQAAFRCCLARRAPSLAVTRSRAVRALLIAGILAVHLAGFAGLASSARVRVGRPTAADSTVTAYILPKIRDEAAVDLPELSMLVMQLSPQLPDLHIEAPQIEFEVARNGDAVSAAPSLIGRTQTDMSPYVREAALLPGSGVTVVLRIEVLEDGSPGRIQVEASGGTRQIDQAAIDYARTRHWNAGRIDGTAHTVWIRWGVRLQA